MGCNSSSVVPIADSDLEDRTGIKVRVNPSTPEQRPTSGDKGFFIRKSGSPVLESAEPPEETLTKDFNLEERIAPRPPLAFEIPIHENGESIIRKHPPKRFRRLEENQMESKDLTHEWIEEKQLEAEQRRNEHLLQRMQSANQGFNRYKKRLVHSDAVNQESIDEEDDGEERKA